jgi:hypothetical protein
LQLLAAGRVLAGNQLARWFGVAVPGISGIEQMFFIPAYPFWSLMIIAVDVVALYGLRLRQPRQPRSRLAARRLTGHPPGACFRCSQRLAGQLRLLVEDHGAGRCQGSRDAT